MALAEIERAILAGVGAELLAAGTGDEVELVRLAPAADAILTNWRPRLRPTRVTFARATRAGTWDLAAGRGLPRLCEQTLGLIGFGNIAQALVPKARGCGLRVLAYTPRLEPGRLGEGVEATNDLQHLLGASDYISLHAPSTPEMHELIGRAELELVKPTAYLINTSRGALVDEE